VKRKSFIPLFFALCALASFFVLRCTQSTKPLEKPRLTAMADTTISAGDTVQLYAKPVFAPDSIAYYIWCFSGLQTTLDTTPGPFMDHVWALCDSGAQRFTVKLTDARGMVSDSAITRITVKVCRPVIALSGDSSVFAGDSSRFGISASGLYPAKTYVWSFNDGVSFTDTTSVPIFLKHWSASDTGTRTIVAFAQTQTGIPSFPETLSVFVRACRPITALSGDSLVFSGDSDLYAVSTSGPCPANTYAWSFNGGASFTDTTSNPAFLKHWGDSDTGVRTIAVEARTLAGITSLPCFLSVRVVSCKLSVRLSGDSAVFSGDSDRYTLSVASSCPVKCFLWSFDNGKSFADTTINPIFLKHWSESDTGVRKIIALAQTQSGAASFPDTLPIKVVSCMPTVHVNGDSIAFPLDTTRLVAIGASTCHPLSSYIWSFDGGISYKDSLLSSNYLKQWGVGDTGRRHIAVKALTANGLVSNADSLAVRVRSDVSPVQLPHDTTIRANDTASISAQIISSKSTISRFFWTVDHAPQEITTLGNTLRYSWPPASVGAHSLKLRATDDHMTGSIIDSMSILVFTQIPTLLHPRDTLLRKSDTLLVTLSASESGSRIVTYLWNIGGLTWTDSTKTALHKISYFGKDTVTIGIGVRDDRGIMVIDSFHIYYAEPPRNIRMISPVNGDTIRYRTIDSTFTQKRLTFRFSALDPNGASDSLTFSLYVGKSSGQLAKVYQGHDSLFTAGSMDTGSYLWRLAAFDRFGDSVSSTGAFKVLLQQTICFAGHSIVSGFTCDGTTGGFRKKVLTTLRSSAAANTRIKPTGPLITNLITPPSDDSCFAVSGYTAKNLWTLMANSFPTLNADTWVVMLGVNGGYYYSELYYLMFILNQIHTNNPQAGIYVINGLPFVPSYGQDKIFNGWLADTIAAKKKLNWNISNIDAFTKFAINDTPNPVLFTHEPPGAEIGLIHPNQAGYDTLANLILRTMGALK
jgi:hypothetical protein